MRVVVSGRIDERNRAAKSLKSGLPLLIVGLILLFFGSWLTAQGWILMSEFVAVANVSEIPDPGTLLVEVGERLVVLIHAAGHFYALDDICTHDGGPLSEGPIDPAGEYYCLPATWGKIRHPNRCSPDDAGD